MASKKQVQENRIERINNLMQSTADEYANGDLNRGFLIWGILLHLDQTEDLPTKDDLIANITDGKDDLEIDFYLIDDEAQTIYLFQSKFRTTPGNLTKKDLADFLEAPARLVSAAYLAKNTNAKIVELAPIFRAKLLEGYQIQLILVTSLNAPPQIVNSVQEWSDRPLTLQIGGESLDITHNAVVSDAEDLLQRFDSGATDKITTIKLQLLSNQWIYLMRVASSA